MYSTCNALLLSAMGSFCAVGMMWYRGGFQTSERLFTLVVLKEMFVAPLTSQGGSE